MQRSMGFSTWKVMRKSRVSNKCQCCQQRIMDFISMQWEKVKGIGGSVNVAGSGKLYVPVGDR
jgi:hypothetical protein